MAQLRSLLTHLTLRQKITILAAALAVAGAIALGIAWNKQRDLRALYTNLAPEDAGALVEKLRASNTYYRVGDNGVILVPSARVAELRLEMAAAGLPRTGRIGYELFDKTNLGSTDFAEHVNFRRAVEGELERSVMALAEVERARVHVTFAKDSVFLENRQPAKASVLVKLRPAARLSQQNVLALQHLASSAVEGLAPESVAVLDMDGNLLSRPRRELDAEAGGSGAMLDYRQGLERDYLAKIRATLDPLLGAEKYRAGASIECDFTSGEQSEESFDPNRSVMTTSQHTEDFSGAAVPSGVPGTASNLPRPAPRPATAAAAGGVSRKTESIAYQTSRVVKHVKLPQGALKRISVAVLVDHTLRWEGPANKPRRIVEPPAPEKLKVVKDLVAGVIGFQAERGDQILVESLPFEATLVAQPPDMTGAPVKKSAPGTPPWLEPLLDKAPLPVWLGAAGALVVVFSLVLWMLARAFLRGRFARGAVDSQPALAGGSAVAQIDSGQGDSAFEDRARAVMAENQAQRDRLEREALAALQLPAATKKGEVLRKVIAEQAKKDPAAMAQLIRTWLTEQKAQ